MTRWMLLLLLVGLTSTASAQDPAPEPVVEAEPSVPWRTSWIPYIGGWSNDGPMLMARVRRWQPADYEARTTFAGAFSADAGISAQGSRFVRGEFEAPLLIRPWRLTVSAFAGREARFGYYGLGNATTFDDDLVTEAQPFLYRVGRTRYRGYAELSRYFTERFLVAAAGAVETSRFTSLPGPSVFVDDVPSGELEEDDASLRLAVVYDSRDNEYNTHRGLLLEVGAQAGTGGENYTRLYTVLRGYLPVREGTVVAARLGASGMGGEPTLNARYTLPTWNESMQVLGGGQSHRALDAGRLAGQHLLFGNVEVRHDLLNLGDLGAITLIGFADAGRVFETESFVLTTDGMKVGGGGGIGLRLLRSTIFTFNLATGPDGLNFSMGNGWMF